MQLIRDGEIAEDRFVKILDDSPIPEGVPVVISAARFLADVAEFDRRTAPTGVLWPNNRRISELAPHLDRVATVALQFPTFRDGRAYSQARQLREQYGFRGELRATGQVLRDQFLFMSRAGFDSYEVTKPADVDAFREATARYSVFYQPTGDGRAPAAMSRLARSRASSIELKSPSSTPAQTAEELNALLQNSKPLDVIREAVRSVPSGRLAMVSSFGIESAMLLKLVAEVDKNLPVIFLDTGWLFEETLAYRDTLVHVLGLTDVRTIKPNPQAVKERDAEKDLWMTNPDACCALRKVEPLASALHGFDAWITGRKRYQGGERKKLPVVEWDRLRLKFNPLALAEPEDITAVFREGGMPRHPMAAAGFGSIGCMPCSSVAREGEDARAGRWRGRGRTECGIHGYGENI